MMTGLEPREFTWVIARRLAVSERIGGRGFQHRRVRREEEIAWLKHHGVNSVLSLLESNQNLASYEGAGLTFAHQPLEDLEAGSVAAVFEKIHSMLEVRGTVLLVHRDTIDDAMAGILAGYLVYSGLIKDPIIATAAIQEILKRPLGPVGRAVIPIGVGT
ncbi:MAG: hypothetical protein KJ698_05585 [Actinobacteria bacterium]|nr:hypothetical protein [Actinomycetota bacterium]MBU1494529.1 hypothetical protein [Actinomycetota bacterium]